MHEKSTTLAHIIDVALGDGNLSSQNGRATRLRVTRDNKYPAIIEQIKPTKS
jgi:phosphotransferase system IIB component